MSIESQKLLDNAQTGSAWPFKFLIKEPLIAILPTGHRLARHRAVRPEDFARESFISTARVAPVLRAVIDDYAAKAGIRLKQNYLGNHLKSGQRLSVQNRPTEGARNLDVLPRHPLFKQV